MCVRNLTWPERVVLTRGTGLLPCAVPPTSTRHRAHAAGSWPPCSVFHWRDAHWASSTAAPGCSERDHAMSALSGHRSLNRGRGQAKFRARTSYRKERK